MTIKRFLGLALALIMVLALVPAAALAKEIDYQLREAAGMKRWDDVWAVLDPVEAEMMASGATRAEVTFAVYKAALNCPLIDNGSIVDLTDNDFSFTTNGMWGGYNYRVRNYDKAPARSVADVDKVNEAVAEITGTKSCGWAQAVDVLLVGPYYGQDGNFTDQYKNEANSIAAATGGTRTMLSGTAATGPAIAQNYTNKGVVIYDSHGNCISSKQTSYLDLTTSTGLTTTDYNNGWAYNGGSFWGIDGRYIQNHASDTLSNCIVWMAICEGMKKEGRGTTGTALLAAGAGCVYGYSQSVSFVGDYKYEATFWTAMKNGSTVAEAFATMCNTWGNVDPVSGGDAWPIVMSADDPFPTNPDSHQTVYCDWTLFPQSPIGIDGFTLSETSVDVYRTQSVTIQLNPEPVNANQYEVIWDTMDPSIATVEGNKRTATITGLSVGTTDIYCDVLENGYTVGRAYCSVNVMYFPTLDEAANVEGGALTFVNATANYPWSVYIMGSRAVVRSGNQAVNSSTSTLRLVLNMQAGEQLKFDWKVSSESNYDKLSFYVNNSLNGSAISGNVDWTTRTYTAVTTGTYTFEWRFSKDVSVASGDDCGYLDNIEYIRNFTPGDVNDDGLVTTEDALLILRYSMGLQDLSNEKLQAADYNGDGVVTAEDALLILRASMGA